MIVANWISMREQWSDLSTTDNDGIKTWDTSRLDAGFVGADITVTRSGLVQYDFEAPFAVDWCLLQPFEVFSLTETSSTVLRATVITAQIAAFNAAKRGFLRGSYLYVKRQSNDAIACASLVPIGNLAQLESTTL